MAKDLDNVDYEMCKHCDHSVDPNVFDSEEEEGVEFAKFIHLDSGEKDHDHDAEPSGRIKKLKVWKEERPDLFVRFPDGMIGPNSEYFTHSLEEES